MARLWYGGTPADFAVALGESVEIPDTDPAINGRTALIPEESVTLDVYEEPDGDQVTDLLDEDGQAITELSTSTDLGALGTIPRFQGPDDWTADLYVSSDGTTFMRLAPSTDDLHDRVTTLEDALDTVQTSDLTDWDNTDRADGNVPVWDNTDGKWKPGNAGTGSVSSVAGIDPDGDGNVALAPSDLTPAAAPASGVTALAGIAVAILVEANGGYPARPSAAVHVIYVGTVTPSSAVDGDVWHQPVDS